MSGGFGLCLDCVCLTYPVTLYSLTYPVTLYCLSQCPGHCKGDLGIKAMHCCTVCHIAKGILGLRPCIVR